MAAQWGPFSESRLVSPKWHPRPSTTSPCPVSPGAHGSLSQQGLCRRSLRAHSLPPVYVCRTLRPAQAVWQAEGPIQVRRLFLWGPPKAGSHYGPPAALAAGGHLRGHLGRRWVLLRLLASDGHLGARGPSLRFPPPGIMTALPLLTFKSRSLKTQKLPRRQRKVLWLSWALV